MSAATRGEQLETRKSTVGSAQHNSLGSRPGKHVCHCPAGSPNGGRGADGGNRGAGGGNSIASPGAALFLTASASSGPLDPHPAQGLLRDFPWGSSICWLRSGRRGLASSKR